MPKEEQTSLEKAFLDFKNLKDVAKSELMSQLEEKMENKILSLINEEIQNDSEEIPSMEEEVVNEGVKITLDIDDSNTSDVDVSIEPEEEEEINVTKPEEDEEMFEISNEAESYQIEDQMNNLEEQNPMAPEMNAAPEAPAAPEMAPEAPAGVDNPESQIIDGIKALIAQDDSVATDNSDMGGEEIDIVDDAPEAAPAAAPAAAAPVAEEFNMDEIFEIIDEMESDDDEDMESMVGKKIGPSDDDITMGDVSEDDDLFEITLELDEEEEELEEMKAMGHGHGIRRTQGVGAGPEVAVKNRSRKVAVNESNTQEGIDTAHHEAKIAELNKENKSLKEKINEQKSEINKFHQSFVELRSQFNEMQTFNAKLAYANKLFANGGFSEKEKLQIAESFDKAANADEAKKLYNSIISENKLSVKDIKSEISATPSRVAKPQSNSQHVVLHESAEMKRMKKLAGINRQDS